MVFALWCGWGFAGSGLLAAWRQGWRGRTLLVGCVLGSFAILFSSALLLQLGTGSLGRGEWFATTVGLSLLAGLLPGRPGRNDVPETAGRPAGWLLALLVAALCLALGVIAYRAIVQPLTGPDTIFRWDFLARQILRQGNMGFYPQANEADYAHYMWADGIPPLVSLLYAWSYMGGGSAAPALTAPVVILVAVLGFMLVRMLASRVGGNSAGFWAVALLAGSALNTWSVSMGQETGVTTLGLLALAWALGSGDAEPDWRLAALAASVAALARDYGPALVIAGLAYLAWRKRPVRELLGFVSVTSVLVAPWYVRNWVRTGNPLFNVDLHGLFPVNRVHADMMESYVARYGFGGHLAERVGQLLPLLWPAGAGVLVAALIATRIRGAWPAALGLLAALWLVLWLLSVGYTAGGIGYSLRVLSPFLAAASVAGGVALSKVRGSLKGLLAGLLVLVAAEASARALVMMHVPSSERLADWGRIGSYFSAMNGTPTHDRAAAIIGSQKVMVDDAYTHAYLVNRGVAAIPMWGTGVAFITAPGLDMPAAMARLRAMGITYIWLTVAPEPRGFFDRFTFFKELDPWLVPVLKGDNWVLFSLREKPAAPA
jgi:hypothetical protein